MDKNLENNKRKTLNILVTLLIITIMFTDMILLGKYFEREKQSYATGVDLSSQDNSTNVENVKFDVYLDTENAGQNIIIKDIHSDDLVIYAYVKVQGGGVLREGNISFGDANFKLRQETDLNLDTIPSGQGLLLEIPVEAINFSDKFNVGLLDMISTIKLTGKYINKDGDEISLYTEKHLQVVWSSNQEGEEELAVLAQEIITNGIFEINGENKRVIQVLVGSGIEGNIYPIKETRLEVDIPKLMMTVKETNDEEAIIEENEEELAREENEEIINSRIEVLPEDIRVATINGTNATNSKMTLKEVESMDVENTYANIWTKDLENGKINIKSMNNPDNKNNVSWKKQAMDEYIITYVYPAEVELENITSEVNSKILLYGGNKELAQTSLMILEEVEEVSNITSFNISITDKIYKSNMNVSENIEYTTKWTIGISYAGAMDSIIILDNKDRIINKQENAVYERSIYKASHINKQEFIELFGEEGIIEIYNRTDNELIAVIEAFAEEDENGNIVIIYPENITEIYLKTSEPKVEGSFNVYTNKELITEGFTDDQIFDINILKTEAIAAGSLGTEILEQRTKNADMKFIDLVTLAKLGLSKTTLSVIQPNDVSFTITLKIDDAKYDLYKNPTFEIEIPSYVREVNVNNIQVLNENNLELLPFGGVEIKENGNKVIKIALEGEQAVYGVNTQIVIDTTLTVEKFIPDIETFVKLSFENGKATSYESEYGKEDIVRISIKSEPGMLLVNSVSNYAGGESLIAFKENKAGRLDTNVTAKMVSFKGTLINNTSEDYEDIVILGRIPVAGTVIIREGQILGTNVDAGLISTINITNRDEREIGYTVYYSELEDATKDLDDPENGWSEVGSSDSKSYAIVLEALLDKEIVEFEYYMEIPSNLSKNQEMYETFEVYYGSNLSQAPILKLETDKETSLNVSLTCSEAEGAVVFKGQNLIYTISIKNTGNINATNVKILNFLPDGVKVVNSAETEWEIPSLMPGETFEKSILAYIESEVEGNTITNMVLVNADYLPEIIQEVITHEVRKSNLKIKLSSYVDGHPDLVGDVPLQIGSFVIYNISIVNTSTEVITDIKVQNKLPEQMKCLRADFFTLQIDYENGDRDFKMIDGADIKEANGMITCNIERLDAGEECIIQVIGEAVEYSPTVTNSVSIICVQDLGMNNALKLEAIIPMQSPIKLVHVFGSTTDGETLAPGDTIEYVLGIKNEGQSMGTINIVDQMPDGLEIVNGKYKINDGEFKDIYTGKKVFKISDVKLRMGDQLEARITVKALALEPGVRSKAVSNGITISGEYIQEIKTREISNLIKVAEEVGASVLSSYVISGTAWLDANRDGKQDPEEELLQGIIVKLKDANTSEYVKDEAGKDIQVSTDKNGKYYIHDLKAGSYTVMFEFDHQIYEATTYQKNGVDEALRSNAITTAIGNQSVTQTSKIVLEGKDVGNVNIGLALKPTFDLSLNKYISKVTVKNQDGTETYTYGKDAGKLTKVDVRARALASTNVIIEYTIEVSNEGTVPGYAKAIADHPSPELKFSSELNVSWYEGSDGVLYSRALENKEIKPGESSSVKLVLTKKMNSNNVGLTSNKASIHEDYNEYATIDLVKGNDQSEADIIVSIRTGSPAIYITVILLCIVMLGRRSILHQEEGSSTRKG